MAYPDIAITDILPQKPPFLFVDKILDFESHKSIVCTKKVSINEPYLIKRHDGKVIFPQTLVIEAAAQTAILFTKLSQGSLANEGLFVLGKIESSISRDVFAGDILELKTTSARVLSNGGYVDVSASVEGELCAEIKIFYAYLAESEKG